MSNSTTGSHTVNIRTIINDVVQRTSDMVYTLYEDTGPVSKDIVSALENAASAAVSVSIDV